MDLLLSYDHVLDPYDCTAGLTHFVQSDAWATDWLFVGPFGASTGLDDDSLRQRELNLCTKIPESYTRLSGRSSKLEVQKFPHEQVHSKLTLPLDPLAAER